VCCVLYPSKDVCEGRRRRSPARGVVVCVGEICILHDTNRLVGEEEATDASTTEVQRQPAVENNVQ
jgi:hypothetical protein